MSLIRRDIFKTLFSITGVVIISKLFGFIKQMVTAKAFGASIETDLILLSEGFISNIDYAIVQTLITSFVATYIHISERDRDNGKRFVSDTIKVISVFSCFIVLLIVIAAPGIAKVLAPTYSPELSAALCMYIRIFAPVFIFVVLRAIFQALLNSNEKYIPGELTAFNQSIVIIFLIHSVASIFGVNTLVITSYISCAVNLVYLIFCARPYISIKRGNPLENTDIHSMLRMMAPLFLGYSMVFINQQIDKIIVSSLEEGTITAMYYGQVISNLVCTLITSFCTVFFTKITQFISNDKFDKAGSLVIKTWLIFLIVFSPVSVVTVICSNDIISIAFGRGAFDSLAVEKASLALMGYGFMFVFYSAKGIFLRFQYGNKSTKTPMINNSIGICVNIILSVILSRFIGILGVTFASSVAEMVSAMLNMRSARKQDVYIKIERSQKTVILIAIIGVLVCIFSCRLLNQILAENERIIRFIISTTVSLGVYAAIVSLPAYRVIKGSDLSNC